VGQKGLR